MRSVSTSLCLLSTPWWRDSLLVGAKEGKRKRKKHELFPEYLFSPSLSHLGFVVYTRLPAPQKGSWNPFLPFEPLLSWKKKEQDSSRRALPKLFILSWRAHHSGCRKRKKRMMSFAALAGLESFLWLWVISNDSEEVLSILQSRPSQLCNVYSEALEEAKKEGRLGRNSFLCNDQLTPCTTRSDYPYLFLRNDSVMTAQKWPDFQKKKKETPATIFDSMPLAVNPLTLATRCMRSYFLWFTHLPVLTSIRCPLFLH